jgi:cephalosporin-C deacetylase-like acetyl esterase
MEGLTMTPRSLTAERLGFQPYLDGFYDASVQLQLHVYRRSEEQFARWERYKDGLVDVQQVVAWQQQVREYARASIGGLPDDQGPLDAEHVGTIAGDGFDVEKIIFQSLPRVYVTANLYLPRGLTGRTGAVLFLCGHAEAAKAYPEYQAVCQGLVRNGLVVLAIDPIGQGERKSYLDATGREIVRWGTGEHSYAGLQCWWLGQSVARYFVHDARRAIDFLASRPEVDPTRIGVTGNSGGGTQTTWLMLLEPRLAAAAPGTFVTRRREYMWTGQAQDAEQIILGGTANGIDHEDFLIAFAPRPVRVLAVDYDFFNLEGTIATVERARRIYRLLGCETSLDLVHTPAGHSYHPVLARAATEFFVRYLRGGDAREVEDVEPRPLEPRDLWCTRSGQVLLDRPETRRVFDLNLEEYRSLRSSVERHADARLRTESARSWLTAQVRRDRRPTEFFPRWLPGPTFADVTALRGFWWCEPDVLGAGVLLRPRTSDYRSLVLAVFDHGTSDLDADEAGPSSRSPADQPPFRERSDQSGQSPAARLPFSAREWVQARVRDGQSVLVVDVRGNGALAPHLINPRSPDEHYGTLFKLLTDLLALNDSLAAMRVYDVLRAAELARTDPTIDLRGRPLGIFGIRSGAFYGYLAAAIDPTITRIELMRPPSTLATFLSTRLYDQEPRWQDLIPGMAAHADLPDLHPLFEGRELIVHEASDDWQA